MSSLDANAAKEQNLAKLAGLGITFDYISELVDSFYDRIRVHNVLGSIFNEAIGENWEHHMPQMKDFWTSVALGTGVYSGKPVPAHRKHMDKIQIEHFDIWLALFRTTLEDTAPNEACVEHFMVRANRIAKSLKLAIFGVPGLGVPKYEE